MPLPSHFDRYGLQCRTSDKIAAHAAKVKGSGRKKPAADPDEVEQDAKRKVLADAHAMFPQHYAGVMLDAIFDRPEIVRLLERQQQELDEAVETAMSEVFESFAGLVPQQTNAKEKQNEQQSENNRRSA